MTAMPRCFSDSMQNCQPLTLQTSRNEGDSLAHACNGQDTIHLIDMEAELCYRGVVRCRSIPLVNLPACSLGYT
jgi:hypothetical protein